MTHKDWQISNATMVYDQSIHRRSGMYIQNGRIREHFQLDSEDPSILNLNLHGFFVFPGLINGHDNLLASYYPFKGNTEQEGKKDGMNPSYLNWLVWDNELKASSLFRERMNLDISDLYQLGSYRNILSGVTTVVDHIPSYVRKPFENNLLPRLLNDFGISHSCCSYSLQWGNGIRQEYQYAAERKLPYVIHIAEGFDEESKLSLQKLDEEGALGEYTVLIHGLSLSEYDLDRIAKAKSHLVCCPVSNHWIYNSSPPIAKALDRGINVCLGSDAAMYGSTNLLEDMRASSRNYSKASGKDLSAKTILEMVTSNPAAAFQLKNHGSLAVNSIADFFVLKGKYPQDPFRSFAEAEIPEIFLVVRDGYPLYGDASLEKIFSVQDIELDHFSIHGSDKVVKRQIWDNGKSLQFLTKETIDQKPLDFMPITME